MPRNLALPQTLDLLRYGAPVPVGYDPTYVSPDVSPQDVARLTVPVGNWWLAGPRGAGKTVLLRNLLVGLARTADVLTWTAEYDGGLAAPWLDALTRTGRARGGIDWPVNTVEGMKAQLNAALNIIARRRTVYRGDILRNVVDFGEAKLPIGPDRPAIVLVLDGADIFLDSVEVQFLLEEVMTTGSQVGVHVVYSTRSWSLPHNRGVVDFVAVFGPDDYVERVGSVFGWPLEDLRGLHRFAGPGDFIGAMTRAPMWWRSYIQPSLTWTWAVVEETDGRRPTLDKESTDAAGDPYLLRWMDDSDAGQMVTDLKNTPSSR